MPFALPKVAVLLVTFNMALGQGTAPQDHCEGLHALRMLFLDHSTLEQAKNAENTALELLATAPEKCAPLIEAHRWVSLARSADFGFNPASKLSRLNSGLNKLDSLVLRHPNLDELKALRLSVTGTAPRFLGVGEHWATDRKAVNRLLESNHWARSPKYAEWMMELAEQIG